MINQGRENFSHTRFFCALLLFQPIFPAILRQLTTMNQGQTVSIFNHEGILHASPDIICAIDQACRILFINEAAHRLLGYTTGELTGQSFLNLVDPEGREVIEKILADIMKGLPLGRFDHHSNTREGKKLIIRWSVNWQQEAGMLYCVGRDITDRLQQEKLQQESEARYRKLFQNNPLPMWIIDPDTKQFLEVNEKAIHHYGYSREEFLSMTAFDIRPEEDRPLMTNLHRKQEGENLVYQGRWRHIKKNGERIDVDITSHYIEHEGRNIALVLANDVTEQVKIERRQKQQQRNEEALINATRDMIWSLDQNFRLLAANRSFHEATQFAYKASLRLGDSVIDELQFPPEQIQRWKALYNRALKGEAFQMQSKGASTNPGEERWWETSFYPIFDGDNVTGIVCHSRDITMNRRYQSELLQLNQKLETAQKIAQLGYWELDLATNDLFWTMEVYNIWDRHPSQFRPTLDAFIESLHPDDRASFREIHARILANEEDFDYQHRILLPDGSIRYVHEKGSIVRDETGKQVRYTGTVQDITQRKLYEQALEQANQELSNRATQLARSNDELERFAYIASHDLQEPLRMVSSFLQLLEKRYSSKLDEAARQYIGFAVTGAERMKRLIRDLLEYSRLENAHRELGEVDMNKVLEEAKFNLQDAISANAARIESEVLPVIPRAQYSGLVQLLQNLLGNAIKYRSADPPMIQVACKEEPQQWLFSVADNGIGIESDYFEKIFIIFQRLHNMSEYSGTGIGLAICKKIVEQHGGKIWVHSQENQGSTFYFTIKK